MPSRGATLRQLPTAELTAPELSTLYALFSAAWPDGGFTDDDFAHGMGGMHWLAEVDGSIVSHASVVPRRLEAGELVLRTGYLEAVATMPAFERRGFGSMVVRAASAYLRPRYELGALSTSVPGFYLRLGWEAWLGPTSVRTVTGVERTEDDDGGIFILRTPSTPLLALDGPLVCDWRSGDVW
ncbi:MAG TPA: GNAT family N-acetyltransferase [Candidatus Limnocylindrales bacterium]|jgi:aminoglycoside 2'-N-acetyltransferase I